MQKYSLQVNRTAHYYTLNQPENCSVLLIALHGYAELAENFIENFKKLKGSTIFIVCPEGLSLFYGRERTPVSSWMTSQHRHDEIEDYTNYLNRLLSDILVKHSHFKKFIFLGFSQGVSTLMRWIWQLKLNNFELHLCCGSIPPELEANLNQYEKITSCHYFYGSEDRLFKPDKKDLALEKLNSLQINHQFHAFNGRHEVPQICLDILSNKF